MASKKKENTQKTTQRRGERETKAAIRDAILVDGQTLRFVKKLKIGQENLMNVNERREES